MRLTKNLRLSYRRMIWFRCGESTDVVTHIECPKMDTQQPNTHKKRSSRKKTHYSKHHRQPPPQPNHISSSSSSDSSSSPSSSSSSDSLFSETVAKTSPKTTETIKTTTIDTIEKKRKRKKVSFSGVDNVEYHTPKSTPAKDQSYSQVEATQPQLYQPICLRHSKQTPWIITHYYTLGSSRPFIIHTYIPVDITDGERAYGFFNRRYTPVSTY
jgi:hypothetical protein